MLPRVNGTSEKRWCRQEDIGDVWKGDVRFVPVPMAARSAVGSARLRRERESVDRGTEGPARRPSSRDRRFIQAPRGVPTERSSDRPADG
jgi:hypothetical protein